MSEIKINTLTRGRRLLLAPLWLLMRLWVRTLRIRLTPEDLAHVTDTSRPTIVVFWHNRLFLADMVYRHYRHPKVTYGLVSASRDGAWLAAFFDLVGLRSVRGSSSRGGRQALMKLIGKLREDNDVALTPDGPRGPMYDFKPGASILIRRSRARILLLGFCYEQAWRINSWDRFYLPLPFSTVRIVTRIVLPEELPSDFEECTQGLRTSLLVLNEEELEVREPAC